MIEVKKGSEPEELKNLREECQKEKLSPKESFKRLQNPLKRQVLECLKRDQGQLCAYCMSKIPREDKDPGMPGKGRDPGIPGQTIEHFIPLEPEDGRDVGQGLDYQNLFAVCHGNTKWHEKGVRRTNFKVDLTCDKHRGNSEFRKIDPCRKETLKTIFYTMDGKIGATDPDVEFDLVDTLNLNCASSPIVSERKAALDALIADIELEMYQGKNLHTYCIDRLKKLSDEKNPKTPYVGILTWYLQSMAKAL